MMAKTSRWLPLVAIAWAISASSGAAQQSPDDPPVTAIAAIVADPHAHAGRVVTVTGRFRGRSRPGESSLLLPLNRGTWDFVLQGHDAAIWISGMQPRGRGFNLDPLSALDIKVGRGLQVTGKVHVKVATGCAPPPSCAQPWIEASAMRSASIPEAQVVVPRVAGPPPAVVFNDPATDEVNVRRRTSIRLQFSNDMEPSSFAGRVRVIYVTAGESLPPVPRFEVRYGDEKRSLEITFGGPLERLQPVRIELLDGITARDGQPLAPWSLTFTTGAS